MDWPTQFSNFNFMENLYRIIKVQININRHQICLLELIEEVIKEEWENLTEGVCIESMAKWCKLVILALGGSIKYRGIYHVERSKLYHIYSFQLIIYVGCNFIKLWTSRPQKFGGVSSLPVGDFRHPICVLSCCLQLETLVVFITDKKLRLLRVDQRV